MRSVLALGLLTILCCSADAATVHHFHTRHRVVPPGFANSWAYEPPRAPIHYDSSPSYYDPSKFGGSTALPVN
jgi:hypothetical protein